MEVKDEPKQDEIVYDDDYIIKSSSKDTEKKSKEEEKVEKKEPEKKVEEKPKEEKTEKKETKKAPEKKEVKKETKKEEPAEEKVVHHHKKKEKDNTLAYIVAIAIVIIIAILLKSGKIALPDNGTTTTDAAIAATVNGENIYQEDIDNTYANIPENLKSVYTKEKILEQEVTNALLLQKAKEAGITVSDEEVNAEFVALVDRMGGEEALNEAMTNYGLTKEEILENLEKELSIKKLLDETLYSNVKVLDSDVEKYYENNIDSFTTPEKVNASHVLICFEGKTGCAKNRTRGEALVLFKDLVAQMDAGANIGDLAAANSDGPSASVKGFLGPFMRGQMVESFENTAFGLDVGEYNSVATETLYGYHLIYVHSVVPEVVTPLEEVREAIENQIKYEKQGNTLATYIDSLKAQAEIDYVTPAALIFLTSEEEWCVHCSAMGTIVEEVLAEGYAIKNAYYESENPELAEFKQKGAPQFICPINGESIVGTTSKDKVIAFAEACN